MPIPKPNSEEDYDGFMDRCVISDTMLEEFPDEEQRVGVCNSAWEQAEKRTEKSESTELTAPIVWKDEEKRIVYGPVLVPGEADKDGDTVKVEKIEEVAHKFLQDYGLLEHMHTFRSVAKPVESYIAPVNLDLGGVRVPKGSWIMGARITDDQAWIDAKSGKLGGFSIVAVPKDKAAAAKKDEDFSGKKVTLRQIENAGKDWEVVAVGLVDVPAVPRAKWTAIKRDESAWEKFRSKFSGAPKAGRTVSDANLNKLRHAQEGLTALSEVVTDLVSIAETERGGTKKSGPEGGTEDMDAEELAQILDAKLKPVTDRLEALETSGGGGEEGGEGKDDKDGDAGDGDGIESMTEDELETVLASASKKGAEEATATILGKFEEHLEKTPRPSAKSLTESLTGQDGGSSAKKEDDSRDAFGRRKTKS